MGKIDIAQMNFLRDPRHFADFWNGIAYDGEQVIKPEELVEISPVGLATSDDRSSKKTADIAMAKMSDGRVLGMMITENQLEADYSIPVRLYLREAMEYDKQVSEIVKRNREAYKKGEKVFDGAGEYMYGFRKEDRLKPVTTLVLYWNSDAWEGAKSLYDMLDFEGAEEMKPLVSDYRMNIANMDKVEDVTKRFANQDVRNIVALFQRRSDKVGFKSYLDENGREIDVDCVKMLNSLIKSTELKDYMEKNSVEKGDEGIMCTAITELIEDGRIEGRSEGLLLANKLNARLIKDKRFEDVARVSEDREYQNELIKELFPDEYENLMGSGKK